MGSFTNVTVSGNTATRSSNGAGRVALTGGIVVQENSGLSMRNVTVAQNSGEVGGLFSNDNSVGMSNTIIANNIGGDCDTVASINGFTNLTGDQSCRFFITQGNQRNVNPLLGPLALNGAENGTRTHALLSGSPALESGSNNMCPARDQRRIRRPSGAACDKGAFEKQLRVLLGTAALSPAQTFATTEQTSTLTLSWTVPPTVTWRNLRTIDFQLDGGEVQPVLVRFSQGVTTTEEFSDSIALGLSQEPAPPIDTLTLYDNGAEAGTGPIGAPAVLEGEAVALDLGQSRLETDGPEGKTVTLTLALRLKRPLAGKPFAATLVASNDAGDLQGPEPVGVLAVGPFSTFVPLVGRP